MEGVSIGNSHPIKNVKKTSSSPKAQTKTSYSTENAGSKSAKNQANPASKSPNEGQPVTEGLSFHGAQTGKSVSLSRSRATRSSGHHEAHSKTTSSMGVQGWPTVDQTEREPGGQTQKSTSRGRFASAFPMDRGNLGNQVRL